jgi:hypothetical protein
MLNACTIIACNYLPFAQVLADSFREWHPSGTFTVLLLDDESRRFVPDASGMTLMRLGDLGLDATEVRRLAGIYDVTELATAVKPLFLSRLLDAGTSHVLYLDPDIRIYDSLEPVVDLAVSHGIVLTPHTMRPYPEDNRQIDDFFVLAAGVYNLGFIAVGQSARPFLDWWWQKTRREALIDVTRMMFTDQRWVDFVPSCFDHYILKDPGYNVAYWNLHGREVLTNGERYLVNGLPLRFFHFSGFDWRKPWLLSKHQGERPRILLSERPALAQLCADYHDRLTAASIAEATKASYGWNRLPGGVELTTRMRRLYWSGLTCAEQGKEPEPPQRFALPLFPLSGPCRSAYPFPRYLWVRQRTLQRLDLGRWGQPGGHSGRAPSAAHGRDRERVDDGISAAGGPQCRRLFPGRARHRRGGAPADRRDSGSRHSVHDYHLRGNTESPGTPVH